MRAFRCPNCGQVVAFEAQQCPTCAMTVFNRTCCGEAELIAMASTPIDPDRIAEAVTAAHARHRKNRRGKNAGYIPALAEVDPQLFGVCVATVDGQTFSAGDARCQFALESISKVFTAALAMEQVGP
ncbi:MAG: glutaminase, partial [Mycobacterium sp.]|nr:glutaminase [Mycobacterium sp.]